MSPELPFGGNCATLREMFPLPLPSCCTGCHDLDEAIYLAGSIEVDFDGHTYEVCCTVAEGFYQLQ